MKEKNKRITATAVEQADILALIRKYAIIALFSDDVLLESLVLKGGNAISMIYGIHGRTSIDIDLSLENDFKDIKEIRQRIFGSLARTFDERGYTVFDLDLVSRPSVMRDDEPAFWGGYELTFKVIDKDRYEELRDVMRILRTSAIPLGKNKKVTFRVDISKHEYCSGKKKEDLENYTVFVYTPEMIVMEKIRTICQQMEEYQEIVKEFKGSARARDFYDIYAVCEKFKIKLTTETNIEILRNIFKAKEVPLTLIGKIKDYYEYHLTDYPSLESTIANRSDLKPFRFYFDYVVDLCRPLESAGDK
ncbi:MAG: hypothetical protein C4574_02055 [Candidatus Latescibacterota bacterium]|jgi:predicted nucleotidyltransferase component of viral defense system|nr:MAG: hypothetical protein C4574_02055 [Candidatus Latescibacterota bacterium]